MVSVAYVNCLKEVHLAGCANRYFYHATMVLLILCVFTQSASANEAFHKDDANLYDSNNFALGVGFGIVNFDTNAKVTDKVTGRTHYIDVEGNLDLPEVSHINTIYGSYHFNLKHSMLFGYFAVNRTSNIAVIDVNFGDVVAIDADLNISDKSRFYYLNYGYTLFHDDRSNIILVVGLNGMDLKYVIDASGQITVGGVSRSTERMLDANVFVPLPMIGLDFVFSFTPEWSLATKVSLVGGTVNDVSATVLQTSINARYRINKTVGLLMGITHFQAAVEIDDEVDVTDISYGYDGGFIGMYFSF